MYIFKKGQRFGNWEVISPNREYIQEPSGRKKPIILCYDAIENELRYVLVQSLLNGKSKSAKNPGNRGWSTKSKNKHLGKYVSYFPLGKKAYRVLKKIKGTNEVITYGYFSKLKDAKELAKTL